MEKFFVILFFVDETELKWESNIIMKKEKEANAINARNIQTDAFVQSICSFNLIGNVFSNLKLRRYLLNNSSERSFFVKTYTVSVDL